MISRILVLFFLFLLNFKGTSIAQKREIINLNQDWDFHFAYNITSNVERQKVNLPHTWNANEVKAGKIDYYRSVGKYSKKLNLSENYKGKRFFLRFEGANSVATVMINQKFVGEHQGGYTAFCFEITNYVNLGGENILTVFVNNSFNFNVLPISGDFNLYGGLHRSVALIVTSENCISPLDYASSGVFVIQKKVTDQSAEIEISSRLSMKRHANQTASTTIYDKDGKLLMQKKSVIVPGQHEVLESFKIEKPRLWNGKKDPYLYRVNVTLIDNQNKVDEINENFGLRYFQVDPQKGFILNGQYLDLHGVCRHEDIEGKGSALTNEDHDRDIAILKDLGATALRLTHYPHSEYFYKACNEAGIVLWTEIPLVGPGGYASLGYLNNPRLELHAKQVMVEMIRQHYNNPSICFWGLFNELKLDYDDPVSFLKELNTLAKYEDPSRLTTCATFLDNGHFNEVSDLIAWNKYFGWYGGNAEQMGTWADEMHQKFPSKSIGISEYGAGASVKQHTEKLSPVTPWSRFHPEEWQTFYHEKNWMELNKRPYMWGKFIWVFRDFGSSIRSEGDTLGMNDKGLLTYDNSIKKDAFYFYKANWNTEPMVYLVERRNNVRTISNTPVKVYSNLKEVELYINGKSIGKKTPDAYKMIVWDSAQLKKGANEIKAVGKSGKKVIEDKITWELK